MEVMLKSGSLSCMTIVITGGGTDVYIFRKQI